MAKTNKVTKSFAAVFPAKQTPSGNGQTGVPVNSPDQRAQLLREVSANRWRLGFSQERLLNPDELVGRQGFRVYRKMLTDDQVKAALALKRHAILSTGWDLEPATNSPQDVEVADFCRWVFQQMEGALDDDLQEILSALWAGFAVTELCYRPITSGQFKDKLGLRALKTRMPDDFIFRVDAHDNLLEDGLEQFGQRYPTWKFAIYSAEKTFDNWYGTSDLRAAYRAWWNKDFALKAWSMFMDRYSVPLALGTYPPGAGIDDVQVGNLRSALENLQLSTAMTFPSDFKVEFPAVGAQGSSVFALSVQNADQAIARAILVPSLLGVSPQGDTGSYSQARKQFDVFILVVEKLQRDLSEIVVGEQIIKRLVDLNYQVTAYPKFIFLPFTETNKSELLSLWFQAIAAGAVTSRPEDEAHVRMATDFPDVPVEELQAAADAEAAKAAAGGGGVPVLDAGGQAGVPSDEELNVLIDQALSGQGGGTVDGQHPLTGQVVDALKAKGVKGYIYANYIDQLPIVSDVLTQLEADHPDWSEAELVQAAVDELSGGVGDKGAGDLSDEDLDALIEEVLAQQGSEA